MITVYLDESGDLGFDFSKSRTSRNFIVTILVCGDTRAMDKLVEKVFRGFTKAEVRHHHGVLHAHTEDDRTRRRVLGLVAREDANILVIRLDKIRVPLKLWDEKHILYNYVVNVLLSKLVDNGLASPGQTITVVASQRETSPFLNANFATYITSSAIAEHGINLNVKIAPPSAYKGLQVVDCVSWAVFRKHEYADSQFAQIVAGRIVEETIIYG